MKSRSWLVLAAVAFGFGILGVVLQVVLSPVSYDSLSNAATFFAVVGVVVVVALIWTAGDRNRQIMRALLRDHPGSLVQLAAVLNEGERAVTASVLVDSEWLGFSSKKGSLRRFTWSQVEGMKSIPWGETIRTGLELTVGEAIRLIPISSGTFLPVSERRADTFFDAIRKAWRLHGTRNLPQPGS